MEIFLCIRTKQDLIFVKVLHESLCFFGKLEMAFSLLYGVQIRLAVIAKHSLGA